MKRAMENGQVLGTNSRNSLLVHREVVSSPTLCCANGLPLSTTKSAPHTSVHHNLKKSLSLWHWKRIRFSELPEWRKSNEYIIGSYRPLVLSFCGCFASIFKLHNETWNIWTHLLGFLFFVGLTSGELAGMFEGVNIYDLPLLEQVMLFLFLVGTMVCFLCSTLFHIFQSHSLNISLFFSRLDYAGIAFLITSSSIPAYYYGLYCSIVAKWIHISIIATLCGGCVTAILRKKFNTPQYRMIRFVGFSLFGLYGAVPFVHIYMRDGYTYSSNAYSLWGIVAMAATYIGGGALYAFRIPERFWPGKFDVWASSHQIFHCCVIVGAIVHYKTLFKMIRYRLSVGDC